MLFTETLEKLSEYYPLQPIVNEGSIHSTWFIPENQTLPLTFFWDEGKNEGITLVAALGCLSRQSDTKIPLELMTTNLIMAASNGPKFSYSPTSGMLTLMSTLNTTLIESQNTYTIRDAIALFTEKVQQARLHLENAGIKLSDSQD